MFRMFTIAQIAIVAAALLGQAQQGTLAFAPAKTTSSTSVASMRHISQSSFRSTPSIFNTMDNNNRESSPSTTSLYMSSEQNNESSLPVFLDPGTKGGAIVLSILLFIIPIILYQFVTGVLGVDEIEAGRDIGVGFSVLTMIAWGATYIFRVATKDMTYAKQLKDYEDAVIAKRLEELDEDEVQALVEDIEREQF